LGVILDLYGDLRDGFPCLLWGPVWDWVAGDDMWLISHGGLVQGSVAV
jgi:hypothetical protein